MSDGDGAVTLQLDSNEHLVDHQGLIFFDENDPWSGNEFHIRLLVLPRGYSIPFGVPAHYLIMESEEATAVQVVDFPAVVKFKDETLPDRLCICVKKYWHGKKICAFCLDLPLQIAATADKAVTASGQSFRRASR